MDVVTVKNEDPAVDARTSRTDVMDVYYTPVANSILTSARSNMNYHIQPDPRAESYSSTDAVEASVLSINDELAKQLLSMDDSDTDDFQEFKRRLGY